MMSTEDAFFKYKLLLYFIALAINIMFLMFYDENDKDFSNSRGNAEIPIKILSVVSAVISAIFLLFWFMSRYPTIRKIKWENYYLINSKNAVPSFYKIFQINITQSILLNADF